MQEATRSHGYTVRCGAWRPPFTRFGYLTYHLLRPPLKRKRNALNSRVEARYVHLFVILELLTRTDQVYAAGSEDMDTLTFHAPILYRHLTFSEARKAPIAEINLDKVLEGLEMNMSQVRRGLRVERPNLTRNGTLHSS